MTIHVDPRVGSGEFLPLFQNNTAKLQSLQFGDFSFMGRGPEGEPTPVGVELKRLDDMLNSMSSGRLAAHQIPGLLSSYKVVYLVCQGIFRPNPITGVLEHFKRGGWCKIEHGRRRWMYSELMGFLTTLTLVCGIHVERTATNEETVKFIQVLYNWFTKKDFEEHKSHLALRSDQLADGVSLTKPGIVQRVAAEFKGVGWKRSGAVANTFPSVMGMVCADRKQWMGIPGIDKGIADSVMGEINGEGDR